MNRVRLGSTFAPYYRRLNMPTPSRPPLGSTFVVTLPPAYARKPGYTVVKGLGGASVYEDFSFQDGYTFRQYADGSITILKSPISKGGQKVTKTNPKTATAWKRITEDIERARAARAAGDASLPKLDPNTRDQIIKASGEAIAKVIRSAGGAGTAKAGRKHKKKSDETPEEPGSGAPGEVPWLQIAVGGAGLMLLFVLFSGGSQPQAATPGKTA